MPNYIILWGLVDWQQDLEVSVKDPLGFSWYNRNGKSDARILMWFLNSFLNFVKTSDDIGFGPISTSHDTFHHVFVIIHVIPVFMLVCAINNQMNIAPKRRRYDLMCQKVHIHNYMHIKHSSSNVTHIKWSKTRAREKKHFNFCLWYWTVRNNDKYTPCGSIAKAIDEMMWL